MFPDAIEVAVGQVKVLIEDHTDKKPQEPTPEAESERTEE